MPWFGKIAFKINNAISCFNVILMSQAGLASLGLKLNNAIFFVDTESSYQLLDKLHANSAVNLVEGRFLQRVMWGHFLRPIFRSYLSAQGPILKFLPFYMVSHKKVSIKTFSRTCSRLQFIVFFPFIWIQYIS